MNHEGFGFSRFPKYTVDNFDDMYNLEQPMYDFCHLADLDWKRRR